MRRTIRHILRGRLLPLFVVMGISFAAPAIAWGAGTGQGDDNQGNEDGNGGPAIPEPSAWLAMGAGLLVFGSYVRSRSQARR